MNILLVSILGVHDATTGFHDIKPPPNFLLLFPFSQVALGAALLLALAGLLLWTRRKQGRKEVVIPETPKEGALRKLAQVLSVWESLQVPARSFAVEVSLILRTYLEAVLSFPAAESTRKETLAGFVAVIEKKLAAVRREERVALTELLSSILYSCECAAFMHGEPLHASDSTSPLSSLVPQSIQLINDTERLISKAEQRSYSIVEQSQVRS